MGEIKLNMSNLVNNNLLYPHKTKTDRIKNKTIKNKTKQKNQWKQKPAYTHTYTHKKNRGFLSYQPY